MLIKWSEIWVFPYVPVESIAVIITKKKKNYINCRRFGKKLKFRVFIDKDTIFRQLKNIKWQFRRELLPICLNVVNVGGKTVLIHKCRHAVQMNLWLHSSSVANAGIDGSFVRWSGESAAKNALITWLQLCIGIFWHFYLLECYFFIYQFEA